MVPLRHRQLLLQEGDRPGVPCQDADRHHMHRRPGLLPGSADGRPPQGPKDGETVRERSRADNQTLEHHGEHKGRGAKPQVLLICPPSCTNRSGLARGAAAIAGRCRPTPCAEKSAVLQFGALHKFCEVHRSTRLPGTWHVGVPLAGLGAGLTQLGSKSQGGSFAMGSTSDASRRGGRRGYTRTGFLPEPLARMLARATRAVAWFRK